jgi:uncharacterized protein
VSTEVGPFLITQPKRRLPAGAPVLLLAHGAGAPMDSVFMEACAARLANAGITVVRFEFAYMDRRRRFGVRLPPQRMDVLQAEYVQAVAKVRAQWPNDRIFIGGKSMGGRVASMIADELWVARQIAGCVCLGYPFHPRRKPEKLRTAHLADLACPTLIVQGKRDALGAGNLVATLALAPTIQFEWIGDGDHDYKPTAKSNFTLKSNLDTAMAAVATFVTVHAATPNGQ